MLNNIRKCGDHICVLIDRRDGVTLECLVDSDDWLRMAEFGRKWSAMWNEAGKTFYVFCQKSGGNRGPIYLHRWIMETPEDQEPDHLNHNGLDNRKGNLRNVSKSINQLNRRLQRNSSTGIRGVSWDRSRGMYFARVKVHRKTVHLGRYQTAEEANQIVVAYRVNILGCLT